MKEIVKKVTIPTFTDERGDLSVLETDKFVDWTAKRIYYVTNTKMKRGGHAVIGEKKFYLCAQGEIIGRLHDGEKWHEFHLKGPGDAILMEGLCWREFDEFSPRSVLIAVSSMNYEKDKYIMNFDEFVQYYRQHGN